MGKTIIEKILSEHSGKNVIKPGDILDVSIDARVARDFGGANVVRHIQDNNLDIDDPSSCFFTFDCNSTGSDQDYAANQQTCRLFAREHGIRVYDINQGIGTHILIEEGLAYPGSTAVSTDSHANILGAVGAFGQGMGDKDIAAVWAKGKVWFRVPESVRLTLTGQVPSAVSAKDMVLNLLGIYGADHFLGKCVEIYGEYVDSCSLDDRITISSMATELGAISVLIPPGTDILRYCESRTGRRIDPVLADRDACYSEELELDISAFSVMISRPGKPHDTVPVEEVAGKKIDSAFIGSCTNGRMEDMREAARILKGKKVAPGVVLKIVPSTDRIWNLCLDEGLIGLFKEAGAMVSNPGCAGCAAGQVGQNGPGEVTVSSGNRNFPGKQGRGDVYLASPAVVAASAVAGCIVHPEKIPEVAVGFIGGKKQSGGKTETKKQGSREKPVQVTGRVWYINRDHIDTDMIYHNSHLTLTDINEMGVFAFGNLKGYEKFAAEARKGDIIVTGRNFGSGSSRQQAVDCFISLGISCIIAESFGAIYERNSINAGFPIMVADQISELDLEDGDMLRIDFLKAGIENLSKLKSIQGVPFSGVQMEIYQNDGLF